MFRQHPNPLEGNTGNIELNPLKNFGRDFTSLFCTCKNSLLKNGKKILPEKDYACIMTKFKHCINEVFTG